MPSITIDGIAREVPAGTTVLEAAREAKAAGAMISYDPNYRPFLWDSAERAREALLAALPLADIVKVSEEEMELLTGEVQLAAGADALYTTNTPLGMKIDLHRRRPALGNGRGPICGPAIRPIGVLRTWELYEAVRLPIIASGGIRTWEDAVEYLLAGACAVGVGSAQFVQPDAASDILSGLERYAAAEGLECLTPLVGAAHP